MGFPVDDREGLGVNKHDFCYLSALIAYVLQYIVTFSLSKAYTTKNTYLNLLVLSLFYGDHRFEAVKIFAKRCSKRVGQHQSVTERSGFKVLL